MPRPTTHQKDLIIDEVVRQTPIISAKDLAAQARRRMPQITEANVQKRVDYDLDKNRASRRPDGRIHFDTSNMAERWVEPFKG